MRVKLKLVNHGCKNNPYWWVVAQPHQAKLTGRYLEHLGIWAPIRRATVPRQVTLNKHRVRYWLSVGAQPTKKVQRLLHKFDFMPKPASPFGQQHTYAKPERQYHMTHFRGFGKKTGHNNQVAFYYR